MKIGLELEFSDIPTNVTIPERLGTYDYEDCSIVNSCGIANDPLKKDVLIGSEINMKPVHTVREMLDNIEELYSILTPKAANFKSNLHVHISIPGLEHRYEDLYKLHTYTFKYAAEVFKTIDPIPVVADDPVFKRRAAHLSHSHHYEFPSQRKELLLQAKTWEEFRDGQQPMKDGVRLTHAIRRCGVNLRSLWDRGTIEFRHFFAANTLLEYESAIRWCILYVENALSEQQSVDILYNSREWSFPRMGEWNPYLLLGWEETNYKYNTRAEVRNKLALLVKQELIPSNAVGKAVLDLAKRSI